MKLIAVVLLVGGYICKKSELQYKQQEEHQISFLTAVEISKNTGNDPDR